MTNMQFMSLKNALDIASFPANYTNEQIVCALTVLANVVKKEIKKNYAVSFYAPNDSVKDIKNF